MASGFDSISSLLHKTGGQDDNSPTGKLLAKQEELNLKKQESQAEISAAAAGLGYVNLYGFPISPEALGLIPEHVSRELKVACFYFDGENMRIAATNPGRQEIKQITDELCAKHFSRAKLYVITDNSLQYAWEMYKKVPKLKTYESGVEIKEADLQKFKESLVDFRALGQKINEVNTTEIITLFLAAAIRTNSSDVHIEAEELDIVVRLRIDGVLQEAARIDKLKWKKIISRLKIVAGVKINVDDQPQDGRYSVYLENDRLDVRVSFLPTAFGESVVMRLLRSSGATISFESLGLRPEVARVLESEIEKPNGLILTTGPTGSGKTTTLYAVLNELNEPGTKIITLEDPIEYQLKGISQSQIQEKKGYTFAAGLRSILRQDPDIVMVGEIRDLETAEIAIQASLTGHLVLSTLHTNDAAGVIPRLLDMGVKPFFLAPAINAVIGQRLVRKVCQTCKVEHVMGDEEKLRAEKIIKTISDKSGIKAPAVFPKIYKSGPGCKDCAGLGYKGRVGIYEIFKPNDTIKELTLNNAPDFKILKAAIDSGMVTMLQDGVLKVIEGQTDLAEIYRVIGKFDYIDELYKEKFPNG